MALPTLTLVQPDIRYEAVVITDNISSTANGYLEFLTYMRDSDNGFITLTLPYRGGLETSIYLRDNCD